MLFNRIIKTNQYGFEYGDDLRNLSLSDMHISRSIQLFIQSDRSLKPEQRSKLATILILNVISKIERFLEENPHLDSFTTMKKIKLRFFHDNTIEFSDLAEVFASEAIAELEKQRKKNAEDRKSFRLH